jgi:acetyl esterase
MPVVLEPAAQQFCDATADPPYLFEIGPRSGRAILDEAQGRITKPPVDIEDRLVPRGPRGEVAVRVLRPQEAPATLPVIVYLHGGGWVLGNTHTHDRLVRELAVGTRAAVVFPSYSLSPEATYPTAIEECFAVARWVADYGLEHGLDPERIALAGDSVGGTIAIALTLLAKERGGATFRHQVLFYPATDAGFDTPSYQEFAEGHHLRRDVMQWFWDQYTPDPAERAQITASPLRATPQQLSGLPPALVITGEADVLRDEGERYAAKLREAGVPGTSARFAGTIHDFVMLDALAGTYAARGAMTLAIDTLRRALGSA